MSTLILSIHIEQGNGEHWKKLQPAFVAETETPYEYGIIVNGGNPAAYVDPVIHIPKQVSHRQGIEVAMEIFRKNRDRFKSFLLLDSDCWPVRGDWNIVLDKLLGGNYLYAAPARIENFDTFPHPSAFYMRSEFLDSADFGFERVGNLLGIGVSDVGTAMPQLLDGRQVWYPLIKTNYLSPHPLYSSIYGDLFYHHCAGSRGPGFRANSFHFYDHLFARPEHRKRYKECTAKLLKQPREFIDSLRGKAGEL